MAENGTAQLSVHQSLRVFTETLQRLSLSREGISFNGRRDLYDTLGYERNLTYAHYYERYRRGGIAKRLIDAPVDATWRQDPVIREKDKPLDDVGNPVEDSTFETTLQTMADRLELWQQIIRVDRLSSLGTHGVLVLGTRYDTDVPRLAEELPRAAKPEDLVTLQAFSEEHATVYELVSDITRPEFGRPATYAIDFSRKQDGQLLAGPARASLGAAYLLPVLVHASRVIHVPSEGPLEDDLYGPPGLEAVWNYLDNLQKVLGGSAEMFWQDAKRRLVLSLKDGAFVDNEKELSAEVEEFVHELRNFLRVQGMEVTQLGGIIPDPRSNFDANIEAICATKKMPKRILLGNELGLRASEEDTQNWLAGTILTRQMRHAEPLLRRFIDRLIKYNYLPRVPKGYEVEWPPARVPTEEEQANIGLIRARTIATLAGTMSSPQEILPLQYMLTDILEWEPDEVATILDTIGRQEAIRGALAPPQRAGQDDDEENTLTPDNE